MNRVHGKGGMCCNELHKGLPIASGSRLAAPKVCAASRKKGAHGISRVFEITMITLVMDGTIFMNIQGGFSMVFPNKG